MKKRTKARKPNLKPRLVIVVMSDPWHTLHLVEIRTRVRQRLNMESGLTEFTVDAAVEQEAQNRLKPLPEKYMTYDMVGVLVAQDDPLYRGRITWANTVETKPAVEL